MAISLEGFRLPSTKLFSEPIRRYTVKENRIDTEVSEILSTNIRPFIFMNE